MSNIARIETRDLLSPQDIAVLRNSKFRGFTDSEIAYAGRVSSHLQLNPLLNQIHFVKRKSKDGTASIVAQVGIDGFRLAAHRAGGYAGSDDAIFDTETGRPGKATVTVYRMAGVQKCSFTATARWDEYFPQAEKDQFMWKRMPHTMLAKCAEALALRKAFPHELAGLKSDEEMAQAGVRPSQAEVLNGITASDEPEAIDAEVVAEPKVTEAQIKRLFAIVGQSQTWNRDLLRVQLMEKYNLTTTKDLTRTQYDELVSQIENDDSI